MCNTSCIYFLYSVILECVLFTFLGNKILLSQQAPLRAAVPAHSWTSLDVDTSKWATELWRPFLLKAAILASARSCSEMQNL